MTPTPDLQALVDPKRHVLPAGQLAAAELAAIRCVCRIVIPDAASGERFGTGFLVAPDVVLTNHHVVAPLVTHDAWRAQVEVHFDARDGVAAPEVVALADDWHIASDAVALDFALVRLVRAVGDAPPACEGPDARRRGWIDVTTDPRLPSHVQILHHPGGGPLMHSELGRVVEGDATRVRYLTNTDAGSSGAPCFDAHWRLVALHHAGQADAWNEGIPIAAIVDHVDARVGAFVWGTYPEHLRALCAGLAARVPDGAALDALAAGLAAAPPTFAPDVALPARIARLVAVADNDGWRDDLARRALARHPDEPRFAPASPVTTAPVSTPAAAALEVALAAPPCRCPLAVTARSCRRTARVCQQLGHIRRAAEPEANRLMRLIRRVCMRQSVWKLMIAASALALALSPAAFGTVLVIPAIASVVLLLLLVVTTRDKLQAGQDEAQRIKEDTAAKAIDRDVERHMERLW